MTGLQMPIFGSFTEEEIRSMQGLCKQQKNDIEIIFGSFDSETLRSVGIVNNRVTSELYPPTRCEQSTPTNITNVSGAESVLGLEDSFVEENGCTISTHPGESGAEELNSCHLLLPESVSYDIQHKYSTMLTLEKPGIHSVKELSSSLRDANLENSGNGTQQVESCKVMLKESNKLKGIHRILMPRGLVNLGNLCFLNATLQALLSCSPFLDLLYELRTRDIPEVGYQTLHAFAEFISNIDIYDEASCERDRKTVLETGKPFQPIMFDPILKSFTPDIPDNLSGRPRQEDAQEFLSFVMHQMHDELLKLDAQISNGNAKLGSLVSSIDDESEDENWETVGPRNRTAITRTQSFVPSRLSDIFGGQLKSVVKARGNKASATIQPFLLLHLNICPESVCTVEDALRLFSSPETLEGYRTSTSGKAEVVTASKSVKILELSQIMILHLMRFSYGSQGSTKLHKSVRYPLEFLIGRDLLSSPSSEGRKYELVATITHHGRDPWKGHYTADARLPCGKWVRYDDASVTQIPESKVLHDQAYLLFYKQV